MTPKSGGVESTPILVGSGDGTLAMVGKGKIGKNNVESDGAALK